MAIDTETKRRSVCPLSGIRVVGPVADGSLSEGDRAHTLNLYSGLNYQDTGASLHGYRKWHDLDFFRTEYR